MRCIICNSYFKQNRTLSTLEKTCEDCVMQADSDDSDNTDDSERLEIETLLNPTGRIQAKFIE